MHPQRDILLNSSEKYFEFLETSQTYSVQDKLYGIFMLKNIAVLENKTDGDKGIIC